MHSKCMHLSGTNLASKHVIGRCSVMRRSRQHFSSAAAWAQTLYECASLRAVRRWCCAMQTCSIISRRAPWETQGQRCRSTCVEPVARHADRRPMSSSRNAQLQQLRIHSYTLAAFVTLYDDARCWCNIATITAVHTVDDDHQAASGSQTSDGMVDLPSWQQHASRSTSSCMWLADSGFHADRMRYNKQINCALFVYIYSVYAWENSRIDVIE